MKQMFLEELKKFKYNNLYRFNEDMRRRGVASPNNLNTTICIGSILLPCQG